MSYDFFEGENTLLTRHREPARRPSRGRCFPGLRHRTREIDYDTQIGGNTAVPLLEVNSIKVIGLPFSAESESRFD